MKKIACFMLVISAIILNGCVQDEKDIFDDPAAIRLQKAIEADIKALTSAENGWFADFYPENEHAIGGYVMHFKFTPDRKVSIGCEIQTNAPAGEFHTSEWDVFAEQSVILSFSTYNPVFHYFSEPYASDVDGRYGDYEFVVMKISDDQIELKGKKHGNRLILRKNTDNTDPQQYFTDVAQIEDTLSEFGMFGFVLEGTRMGVTSVVDRTFTIGYTEKDEKEEEVSKTKKVAYTFTPTGIRFYEPFVFNGKTMQNFVWQKAEEKYVCTDENVNAYFDVYFPSDYQLRYGELVGTWEMRYHGASTTTFETVTATIEVKKKNATLNLKCDAVFSFPGIEITFDPQKGIISILNQNAAVQEETGYFIRVCAYDRVAGYLNTSSTGPVGIVGVWNKDAEGKRQITFVDNGVWGTYKPNGILLRLYDSANTSMGNFTSNKGGYRLNDITITKMD
ncbi:MAG: DUF4302 domain-containing protein [Dysgonamonadaceae bacterium]|nr:DUF4302 domain-containing protein [Dysgonamonadaceae bacterium]